MRYPVIFATVFLMLLAPLPAAQAEGRDPVQLLRAKAIPLKSAEDLAPLVQAAEGRSLVLLGEASHGTSEFYSWRTEISRRLIEEKGFRFIAVEGDWAASYRLNEYVRGRAPEGESARSILERFDRWPTWMWANRETAELIEWLREYNAARPAGEQVGFYGIDVYGAENSMQMVLTLVREVAPDLAENIQSAYGCLEPFADDFSQYARALSQGGPTCQEEVRSALGMIEAARESLERSDPSAFFNLEQNALVVKNAEGHYRAMPMRGALSWNRRVDHFFLTAQRLLTFYGEDAKGIVWAHNTHIGDARATAMAPQGQRNIGQLARQRLGAERVLAVGFGTHRGSVMAGQSWGAKRQIMSVPPAREGSFEDLLHRTEKPRFLLLFSDPEDFEALQTPLGHRAIGVVFDPRRERVANYVGSVVPLRYDAFIFLEETTALQPIH